MGCILSDARAALFPSHGPVARELFDYPSILTRRCKEHVMHLCQSRRRFLSQLGALCSVFPVALRPQDQGRSVRRVGYINGGERSLPDAFRDALRALGHVEGQNLFLDLRFVSGADFLKQTAEIATSNLELVVAGALPFAVEIRRANPAMPMVVATCPGMVSNGFAKTLEHPGGNVTGIDELPPGVTAKRLTLLKTVVPSISRVALLSTTPGVGGHEAQVADAEQVAASLKISVKVYRAPSPLELQRALTSIAGDDMNGLANFQGALSIANRQMIVDFAATHRLPAVYQATMFVESGLGGLMAWAPDLVEQQRIAARYVDQILKGAKPGDLPIRYPPRYFWTVNQTAARGLGLTLSPSVLAQADRVIS
jgi:putative tryptophan/tyrosine transport system substrate-binding protein